MKALLPALFLGILTFWSGTFAGGATFSGAVSAHAVILAFCLLGAARWRDPLGLGSYGKWLLPALLVALGAGWWLGPVPRAGIVGLVLLPAFLLIPSAVAACWRRPSERRLGLAALGLVLGLVAALALVRWQVQGSPRAAMPLGHHNLLAVWLVIIWPVGLASLAGRGAGRRILGTLVGASAVAALAVTGSFLASCALLVQSLLAAIWWKRARPWLALALVVVWIGPGAARRGIEWLQKGPVALEGAAAIDGIPWSFERAARVLSGSDGSSRVRTGYARAGWRGSSRRPFLGWGPGSVPWTLGRFLEPVAGLHPASEVVGDLHSWPLQLGYETGAAGLALVAAIGWLFARRRHAELATTRETVLLQAALVGLGGGAVMLLGNAQVTVLALPAAVAVVAGAALACNPRPSRGAGRSAVGLGCLYLLPAALVLLPLERAHYFYQRAVAAETRSAALAHVRRASELDPAFPLYRARAAWLAAELGGPDAGLAEGARRAAVEAQHLAPLWLAAGVLGLEADQPWAEEALERARRLDPLSPLPAFHLLRARPASHDAVELGVEALAGDRRLGAAVFWEEHPELREAVLERLGREAPGAAAMLSARTAGPTVLLVQSMDVRPALSFSLFAFRRSPWPADFAPVEVRSERLSASPGSSS